VCRIASNHDAFETAPTCSERRELRPGDGGFGIGVAYQSLVCLVALPSLGVRLRSHLSVLVGVLFLAAIVIWIIYWVRISRLNRAMESTAPPVLPTALAG
jgi:hypothetical protein